MSLIKIAHPEMGNFFGFEKIQALRITPKIKAIIAMINKI
jgi:hypothetical protein